MLYSDQTTRPQTGAKCLQKEHGGFSLNLGNCVTREGSRRRRWLKDLALVPCLCLNGSKVKADQ